MYVCMYVCMLAARTLCITNGNQFSKEEKLC